MMVNRMGDEWPGAGPGEAAAPIRGCGWEPAVQDLAQRLERILAEPVRGLLRVTLRGQAETVCPGLGYGCELEPLGEPVGVVWRSDLAAGVAARLLGGGEPARGGRGLGRADAGEAGDDRPACSPMEARLLERLTVLVLGEWVGSLAEHSGLPITAAREVVSLTGGVNPWGGGWLGWSLEVSGPGFRGELQCLLPGCLAEFCREQGGAGGGSEPGEGEGEEYEVVIVELELPVEEWEGLTEGDLVLTEREAGSEVELRGAGGERLRGEAGVYEGVRVVRVGEVSAESEPGQ